MVQIIKASGDKEIFKKNKIQVTAIKAGASKELAKQIANNVANKVRAETSTKQILQIVLKLLKNQPTIAARYDLKRAIMSLGPHGFTFEEFFSQLLQNYNYKTKVGLILKGKATTHEVDIVAKENKTNKKYMIEAKYHNRLGNHTNSKVAMYTYARFLDLQNNSKNKINQGWLVTNTKCTPHAVEYSKGVNLKITSWQYASKGEKNLQQLIMQKKLYPITIFKTISNPIKEKLFQAKIILAKDLINYSIRELSKQTHISKNNLNKIILEAKNISGNKKP